MSSIFEFEIKVAGIEPAIRRRIQINANDTFEDLHMLLQIVFGWNNIHLFEFTVDGVIITMPDEDGNLEPEDKNAFAISLSTLLTKGKKIEYLYDFDDNWAHEITLVEELKDELLIFPNCLSGERGAPIENSGGIPGYLHILDVLTQPQSEEYEDIKEWVGDDFDPEEFDLAEANEIIIEYFSQKDREN